MRGRRTAALALALAALAGGGPTSAHDFVPQVARGITLPAGFGLTTFATTPGLLPTSLTFGPDGRLYVAAVAGAAVGNGFQFLSAGSVLAFDDLGGVGGPGRVAADGLNQVLGVAFGPQGELLVADNAGNAGRVQALRDLDDDGLFETRRTLLRDIPNGRHQSNGMALGADGMIYLANGNATDDGIECGPEPVSPLECPTQEVPPWTGAILRIDPSWNDVSLRDVRVDADATAAPDGMDDESVLVARGFRNIYDVAFRPASPSMIYTPMNGPDNPAANEPLYRTDVADAAVVGADGDGAPIMGPVIDDAGFPSCLYGAHENHFPEPDVGGHEHPETFTPEDTINEAVLEQFGPCDKDRVIRPIMFFAEAHNGTSGLEFERGDLFPDRYDGDLFVAEWGSLWNVNGAEITGRKVTHIDIGSNGLPERRREFMTGLAPIDVTFGPDGAMYVADFAGVIYRVAPLFDTPDGIAIEMRAGQFVPQVAFVPKGTRVTWVNSDALPHNVRATRAVVAGNPDHDPVLQSGSSMNSPGDVAPGGFHSHFFGDLPGAWAYRSTSTPLDDATMNGAIVVLPVDR